MLRKILEKERLTPTKVLKKLKL